MKRIGPLAALLVLAVGVSACGVPTNGSPNTIDDDDLPAALRAAAASTTTTTSPGTPREPVDVYFIRDDALVRATMDTRAPADLVAVLSLLQAGPGEPEAGEGVRSALTGTELILSATRSGSTAFVDLGSALDEISPADQILALGQIVLTATARPGVERVRLTVDGEPTPVPTGNGSLTTEPLRRADYRNLLGP